MYIVVCTLDGVQWEASLQLLGKLPWSVMLADRAVREIAVLLPARAKSGRGSGRESALSFLEFFVMSLSGICCSSALHEDSLSGGVIVGSGTDSSAAVATRALLTCRP